MHRRLVALAALVLVLAVGSSLMLVVWRAATMPPQANRASLSPGQTSPPTPAPTLAPDDLAAAFDRPMPAIASSGRVVLRAEAIDDLVLPSGRVVAADAFATDEQPLTTTFAPGRYPITLLVASFADGDVRVAAARMESASSAAVRWDLAVTAANGSRTPAPGTFFGYAVDSGTGSFFSPEAGGRATADDGYGDRMIAALDPVGQPPRDWADVVVDRASGANVIAFTSGFGDGGYATYVGFDRDGAPVALMTDFQVLDRP